MAILVGQRAERRRVWSRVVWSAGLLLTLPLLLVVVSLFTPVEIRVGSSCVFARRGRISPVPMSLLRHASTEVPMFRTLGYEFEERGAGWTTFPGWSSYGHVSLGEQVYLIGWSR